MPTGKAVSQLYMLILAAALHIAPFKNYMIIIGFNIFQLRITFFSKGSNIKLQNVLKVRVYFILFIDVFNVFEDILIYFFISNRLPVLVATQWYFFVVFISLSPFFPIQMTRVNARIECSLLYHLKCFEKEGFK